MTQLESITVNENGSLNIPKDTYNVIATAARKRYNFKGASERTVKKYVIKYIKEAITEYMASPDKSISEKEETRNA